MIIYALIHVEVLMISRVRSFIGRRFKDYNGRLKQGHEFRTIYNFEGNGDMGIILRWKDGKLNDDGEYPAVEFEDSHVEHFHDGLLHYDARWPDGLLKPAIISVFGEPVEYYINGEQVYA
jgi:hypothetical protein